MNRTLSCLLAPTLAALLSTAALGQADVIVGDLNGVANYSQIGSTKAYAIGTTSCNIGTVPLQWVSNTPAHPVIGQNIYRIKDGSFEQIGIGWLKHGFFALQQSLCGPCSANPNGSALGVGCSDPYGASLNGSQSGLGPRYQVNPKTGVFPYPFASPPITGNDRRILVPVNDVLPAQNPGAVYVGEGHYVAADDAQAGNGLNNASRRYMTFNSNGDATMTASTVREEPAILAWPEVEPTAQVEIHDENGERFYVGFNFRSLGGGLTRYFYAVHNLNSDRAAGGFSVALPAGATVQNVSLHATASHSGSLWAGKPDWTSAVASNGVSWSTTTPFATDVNGRAIRWGQCFTFSFDTNATPGAVTVDYFKPGAPASFTINTFSVPTEEWQVNTAAASLDINGNTNDPFTGAIQTTAAVGSSNVVTWSSTNVGAPFDIVYQPGDAVSINNGGILYWPGYLLNIDLFDPLRPWGVVFGGFMNTMPSGGQSLPFTAPPVALSLCAQLAILDASSPVGVSFSAANDLDVVPCSPVTLNHSLGDDNSVQVTLGAGGDHDCIAGFTLYGTSYTDFFINSNGSLTCNAGTGDFTATLNEFRSGDPRFAGMWSDLSPNVSGTITSTGAAGMVTVSFNNVPEYGNGGAQSSFDMIIDDANGLMILDGYAPAAGHGTATLVGLSPGGNATANSVTYGSLSVGQTASFGANQVIYEFVSGGAPTGFSRLEFSTTGGTSVTRAQ